jgi:short-subunit dehydrogenase
MKPLPKGWAVVTGASSGIGAVYARSLAARGQDLVLVARGEGRLRSLAGELSKAHGVRAEVLAADLGDPAALLKVEERVAALDPLALLVNNAGFGLEGPYAAVSADDLERMLKVHVLASVRLTRAALRPMLHARAGAIVNVSSVAAFTPFFSGGAYGASKAYLNYLTEALAAEHHGRGVRFQALCPGFTHTEFHQRAKIDERSIPSWTWMRAEQVVEASLRGLERGKVIVVPGLLYKALVAISRTVPTSWMAAAARATGWR